MEGGLKSISFVSDDLHDLRQRLEDVNPLTVVSCLDNDNENEVVEPDTPLIETLLIFISHMY